MVPDDIVPDDMVPPMDGPAVCLHPIRKVVVTAKMSVAKDSLRMT